jgi:hypothetical protein
MRAHHVVTTRDAGWQDFSNGLLLSQAATRFDLFLTTDKHIRHQQNLSKLPLPVIELNGVSNRLKSLQELLPFLDDAIQKTSSYKFIAIFPDGRIECLGGRIP